MTQDRDRMADAPALADVVKLLARIHDREVDAAFLEGWQSSAVTDWMAGILESAGAVEALSDMGAALGALSSPLDSASLDDLASDYADIYLTHAYRISPNGSVWLTEDGLERQEPMFETRSWYRRYGVEVPDWRKRPDDNIVHQLQFTAHLLSMDTDEARADCARFLDSGLLVWLPDFAARVDARARTPFYRAAARLTHAVVEEIRDGLLASTGIERRRPEEKATASGASPEPEMVAYVPGQAESW
ncbi:molecular chaperone [Zhengella sp. ZM62]|uniref:TorD/DmsD family molecular chaperone n=1 Tax=Zhengella sedimenti TaxID=3390035 RepID=UPI003974B1F4